jgi:hypothetical protein
VPPKKQLEPNAEYTTVGLTPEHHEAVHEIAKTRKGRNPRTSLNSILVDALWELLRKETGKTRAQIRAQVPEHLRTPEPIIPPPNKVAEISKAKKKY